MCALVHPIPLCKVNIWNGWPGWCTSQRQQRPVWNAKFIKRFGYTLSWAIPDDFQRLTGRFRAVETNARQNWREEKKMPLFKVLHFYLHLVDAFLQMWIPSFFFRNRFSSNRITSNWLTKENKIYLIVPKRIKHKKMKPNTCVQENLENLK